MFSDLAVSQSRPVRRWTAMASFTLQAALVGVALAYPLFHIESLPPMVRTLLPPMATFAPSLRPQTSIGQAGGPAIHPLVVNNHFSISLHPIADAVDAGLPQPPQLEEIGMLSDRNQEGLHSIMSDYVHPLPSAPAKPHVFRQSVVMEGNLIHKVEPPYPAIARQLHIEGAVIVKAIISRDGIITHAEAESGQTLLAQAALAAIRQWRYRPYYLNHEPIEVETEIRVNFVLGH